MIPERISGVVFDCDGLLLDTEACWSRAEAALFAGYGFPFGPAEKDLLIGRTLEAACANMADHFGIPGAGPRLIAELLPLVRAELAADIQPLPGAERLVTALSGRVPLAVATNSPRALLDVALDRSRLAPYFDVTIAADEVTDAKPHPELYLTAFARIGADPRTGVTLEDSATGVAAARASGSFVIAVPSQPGRRLDGDLMAPALTDDRIQDWARRVRVVEKQP